MHLLLFLTIFVAFGNGVLNSKKLELNMKKDNFEKKLSILYKPKTNNQKQYVNALNNKEDCITIVVGPAGTGKTLLACNSAINYLKNKIIDKIIITRPVVPVEEDIGFLPGTLTKKMDPWTRPLLDIFDEYYSKSEITNMILNGQIEISPLGFMRGRTFKNSFIIADEMQNSSPNQMYMLLTRIGTNSRMVITGDLEQSDKFENNGLKDLIKKYNSFKKLKNIELVQLNTTDVQRSDLVSQVLDMYKPVTSNIMEKTDNSILEINKEKVICSYDKNITNKSSIVSLENTDNGNNDAALIPKKDMLRITSIIPPIKKS